MTLHIGSLCSGVGGFELGLEWAGVGRTIWHVEIDKDATMGQSHICNPCGSVVPSAGPGQPCGCRCHGRTVVDASASGPKGNLPDPNWVEVEPVLATDPCPTCGTQLRQVRGLPEVPAWICEQRHQWLERSK